MHYPLLILSTSALLCFFSCQQPSPSDSLAYEQLGDQMVPEPVDEMELDQDQEPQHAPVERKLIKEGYVTFETQQVDSTRSRILAAVQTHKGYISSDQSSNYAQRISHTLIIRVPADKFDQLLADIAKGVDHFDDKNISVRDVTEEFLDISARLKTKKELENRFTVLLQKANTVSEILSIEREIGNLRAEIESIEGRLKYLENQVGLSTLHITFYETIAKRTAFGKKFIEGFRQGWDNLIWFLIGLVNVWPFLLLIPLLIWGIRKLRRRRSV